MRDNQRIDFEDVKRRTVGSFGTILSHYGIRPVKQGEQTKIPCPFHDDQHPSCSVNLERGLFHCFAGGCGAEGNHLEFVWKMETRDGTPCSLPKAARTLAAICGIEIGGKGSGRPQEGRRLTIEVEVPSSSVEKPNVAPRPPQREREEVPTQNRPLSASFVERFTSSLDRTHPYLAERGIPPAMVEAFGLGVSTYAKGSMANRLCVPIHNPADPVHPVAYAGRFAGEPPDGVEKWMLPKEFHKALELFNIHRVLRCRHLVVVEGFLDAIRLHSLKVPAVALMGTSISDEQISLLLEHCPTLRATSVLLDGDQAGREAGPLIAAKLARHWFTRIVELPDGADPASADGATLLVLLGRER